MAFENISIAVAGVVLKPVTIQIKIAHDEAARSFSAKIKTTDYGQPQLLSMLANSQPCKIYAAGSDGVSSGDLSGFGDLILTGFIEKRGARLASEEQELEVSGRSKTADLVDSSHNHKTGEFLKKTQKDILSELSSEFGVKVESDIAHKPRDVVRLRPGESPYKLAERLARAEGNTVTDTPEGNLKLVRGASQRHSGAITDGDGWPVIKDGSAVHDDSKRFSEVVVKAQAPDGYAPKSLQIEEKARDTAVGRRRLRVVVPPEQVNEQEARDRAKWHRDRAAGRGVTCEVTLEGWRDSRIGGRIWTPGWLVYVELAQLGLAQEMMIESVSLDQADADAGGTKSTLSLVDPRAYGGKSGKGSQSGKEWDLGKKGSADV